MKGKEVKAKFRKGFWRPEEDLILKKYVETHGEGNWTAVSKNSGLLRGAKSCRLRWKNYLRPNLKRGMMSEDEKDLIIRLHKLLGNRWSLIAGRLPGRTDNEVKNYWNTHLNKRIDRDQTEHQDSDQTMQRENIEKMTAMSTGEVEAGGDANTFEDSWVESLKLYVDDYNYMDIPSLPTQYSPLIFHNDETFMPILDNLVLLEACTGDEMMKPTSLFPVT